MVSDGARRSGALTAVLTAVSSMLLHITLLANAKNNILTAILTNHDQNA